MAAISALSWLNGIGLVLLFATSHGVAWQNSGNSGILSNLYKKAAQENRPMILVLDNSISEKLGKNRDNNYSPNSLLDLSIENRDPMGDKKRFALSQEKWPFNLISYLIQQNYQNKEQISESEVHDHSSIASKNRNRDRRIQSRDKGNRYDQDNRNDRDQQDDRDRRDRYRGYSERYRDYRDRRDRNRNNRDRRDRDRNNRDRKNREIHDSNRNNPDRHDHNKHNRNDHILRALLEENLKDVNQPNENAQETKKERAPENSVLKNLLRMSNDLNCEAQDKCQNRCDIKYYGKKKYECEDKCEIQFECDEYVEDDKCASSGDCSLESSCGDSDCDDDKNPSTRGVPNENQIIYNNYKR